MTDKKREVAEMDIRFLRMLRDNVSSFMKLAAAQYDRADRILLDVAPQDHEGAAPYFKQSSIESLDIDVAAGATYVADICRNNRAIIPDGRFDLIVCTEVLEHTLNPFAATDELCRMLKPGGFAFISVPFNFRIHGPLPDCWRISEHGLKALFSPERKFEILQLNALEDEDRFLMPIHYTLIARKCVPSDRGLEFPS